jgi:hypothetical protein
LNESPSILDPTLDPLPHPRASQRALIVGLVAFVAASAVTWPYAISFGDEIGYLGQSQLLLAGRISPLPDSPGVFHLGPGGVKLSQYPLFVPLVLTPILAVAPRMIFALGLVSVVAMVVLAAKALRSWGGEPALGLLFAVHPTFVLIARTAMPDTWLTAAALGAWWFGKSGRRALAGTMMALMVLLKPTGVLIAGALVAGEVVGDWFARRRPAAIARRVAPAAAGIAAGSALAAALNWIHWHNLRYTYSVTYDALGYPAFSLAYLRTSGVAYLLSLLLVPPGLLFGAWGLWRRRLFGPLFVVGGLCAMMAVYFFVDTGRSWAETAILTQRLVLPASGFLLLGLCVLISPALRRLRVDVLARPLLAVAIPAVALAVGLQHRSWQRPMHEALLGAERIAAEKHVAVLGSSHSALKAALMHRGPVTIASARGSHPPVVLCSLMGASYRQTYQASCDLPGYDVRESHDSFRVLVAR